MKHPSVPESHLHLALILGTRPEAIKLAPVALAARGRRDSFQISLISTGQHREMAREALAAFDLKPDVDLGIMEGKQSPTDVLARILDRLPPLLKEKKPDIVLVQGDTSTTLAAALCAHHMKIPVGHVEAGLRTESRYDPFPEEMNRRLTSRLASYHFAPTPLSREHLLQEGISEETILVTGNSGIDALCRLRDKAVPPRELMDPPPGRMLLLTCHRRENHGTGTGIQGVCGAVRDIVDKRGDTFLVCPVHPSPQVNMDVERLLQGIPRVILLPPVNYLQVIWLLKMATLVLTDSGGIQEEAPAFGKPVLVLREYTERPEGILAGVARLVGTEPSEIVRQTFLLLDDREAYGRMARAVNPYGDGHAAGRILDFLIREHRPNSVGLRSRLIRNRWAEAQIS